MIALKDITSGEFFDIPSDIALEIERNNPFLGTDEISGENSLPVNIFYTDKNYRLINYYGNFYKRNQKLQIDVELYDDSNYKYSGTLVVQSHTTNINRISDTIWVGIVTFNSSSFYQSAKNVLLHKINLGGVRSFPLTTDNPTDGSGGFWQHIHAARVPDAFDYTFYPISNAKWTKKWANKYAFADDDIDFYGMNILGADNNFKFPNITQLVAYVGTYAIVPMIYVSYILKMIFQAAGWQLTGDVLDDPGFKKLTLVGTRSILFKKYNTVTFGAFVIVDPFVFDLKDYVTEGITVYKFLIDFKNRFGWKFTFNSNTKTATLSSLKSDIDNNVTDWTKYLISNYKADYKENEQTYSFVNNIDTNDLFPLSADTNRAVNIAPIAEYSLIPAAATQVEGVICYAFKENTWYQNTYNATTFILEWVVYSHNIDSYLVDNSNVTIETDISTMPTLERGNYFNAHRYLLPIANYEGNAEDNTGGFTNNGMRVLFYHGMVNDSAGTPYPYASCHSSDIAGNDDLTPWSISYRRQYGAINNGVYEYWFKDWIEYIDSDDIRTFVVMLPLYILQQFSWNSCIRINDVNFIPVSYREIIPYPGMVEFKMKRVN